MFFNLFKIISTLLITCSKMHTCSRIFSNNDRFNNYFGEFLKNGNYHNLKLKNLKSSPSIIRETLNKSLCSVCILVINSLCSLKLSNLTNSEVEKNKPREVKSRSSSEHNPRIIKNLVKFAKSFL